MANNIPNRYTSKTWIKNEWFGMQKPLLCIIIYTFNVFHHDHFKCLNDVNSGTDNIEK